MRVHNSSRKSVNSGIFRSERNRIVPGCNTNEIKSLRCQHLLIYEIFNNDSEIICFVVVDNRAYNMTKRNQLFQIFFFPTTYKMLAYF